MTAVGLDNKDKIATVWLASVCGFNSSKLRGVMRVGSPSFVMENYEKLKTQLGTEIGLSWYDKIEPIDQKRVYNMVKYFSDNHIYVLLHGDLEYPTYFYELSDYPPILYCKGDLELFKARGVAVVGSREPSKYGLAVVNSFVEAFVAHDLVVISGLARGIDTASHMDALAHGGKTIAVLGTGIDMIYPAENSELYERIAQDGLIVTEYSVRTPANAYRFPERNRLISALSEAVFVAEASEKSGSLITARCAKEQGKLVFSVPVEINNPRGLGNNYLLKRHYAEFVTNPTDILVDLGLEQEEVDDIIRPPVPDVELSEVEQKIVDRLSFEETHFDDLLELTSLGTSELSAILTKLELLGLIIQLDNNYLGV